MMEYDNAVFALFEGRAPDDTEDVIETRVSGFARELLDHIGDDVIDRVTGEPDMAAQCVKDYVKRNGGPVEINRVPDTLDDRVAVLTIEFRGVESGRYFAAYKNAFGDWLD